MILDNKLEELFLNVSSSAALSSSYFVGMKDTISAKNYVDGANLYIIASFVLPIQVMKSFAIGGKGA